MYEVISTAVDTIENDETDEGSLLIFGGRQRAFVVARFTRQWRTCLLFVYCEETNEQNEPLEAWWSVQVALHSISEFKPNFEFVSLEVKLRKMINFY